MFEETWERFGRLDVLVNSAGGQFPQAAIDFSVKGWNAVIDTNLNGTWYMMQSAAQHWRDSGARRFDREHRRGGLPRHAAGGAHAAARAGVIYLSKTLSVEWAPLNIRVNCVAPGIHRHRRAQRVPARGGGDGSAISNPMKRLGDVMDIAQSVVYLAAPTGKFITGEVLTVDGGRQNWGEDWPGGIPDYFRSGPLTAWHAVTCRLRGRPRAAMRPPPPPAANGQ